MKYLTVLLITILFLTGCEDRGYGAQEIENVPSIVSDKDMSILDITPDTNISKSSYINIKFSSFVDLSSLTSQNITLKKKSSDTYIDLFEIDTFNNYLYIKPNSNLEESEIYILEIKSSIKDIMGNSLNADYSKELLCKSNFWKKVEAGQTHSMAESIDGDIYVWGSNSYKELFLDNNIGYSIPLGIINTKDTKEFSAGSSDSALIDKDEILVSVGKNSLQDSDTKGFFKLSVGYNHTASIKADGTLWSWGKNSSGQLGNLGILTSYEQTQEYTKSDKWTSISAGDKFTIALKEDKTMWGWGNNEYGQIGNSAYNERRKPVQEDSNATDWIFVSAGADHSCAIKSNGTLWSWGLNLSGQLGNANNTSSRVAVQEDTNSTNWVSVSTGLNHTVALKSNGELWTWGSDYYGQLGNGESNENKNSPTQIDGTWSSVSAGGDFTIAIKTDGTLWAWGYNANRELGLGNDVDDKNEPTEIGGVE
ncbi:MAG: Ig-like domain-containing protein [Campylobacterota bacterium]|nr:Ig-like domain-containing protein [Campylobacterota bacterium]